MADESWREYALCRQIDTELFFPDRGSSTRQAKSICANCEVKAECLSDALARDDRFGIHGGLSERERRALKKRLAAAALGSAA